MNTDIIELPKSIMRKDEHGIIHFEYKHNVEIGLHDTEKELEAAIKLSSGKQYLALIDLANVKSVSKEARKLFSSEECSRMCKITAFYVTTSVSKVIGNFFMGFNRPLMPVKLFGNKEDAVEWLKEYEE